ncbi:MAG: sigma-70 family RNA polymerase sigma factor [Longimicrobiales bacterium]
MPLEAFRQRVRLAWEQLNRRPGARRRRRAPRAGRDRTADAPSDPGETPLRKAGFAEEALPWLNAVYRFAMRLTQGDADAAEDLVQETYLRAYRGWERYERGSNCRSWLFTICRNAFLHTEERKSSQLERPASELDVRSEALGVMDAFGRVQADDPQSEFFESFIDQQIVDAIDRLPVEFRDVLVLSDLGELTYPEISQVLEVPLGTVKSRLFRARRLLQNDLVDYAIEAGYLPGAVHD